MSYLAIVEISESNTLRRRIQAAVAQEMASLDITVPSIEGWVNERMLRIAASSGWAEKWQYAKETYKPDFNPDTGARTDVINDADILAVVQPLVQAMAPDEPAE